MRRTVLIAFLLLLSAQTAHTGASQGLIVWATQFAPNSNQLFPHCGRSGASPTDQLKVKGREPFAPSPFTRRLD
jgi:hypothetical protein